ncbi:MAG: DNA-directed RNA polymerase subunit omega [Lactobacillaceae bacterium]|jgi:DNA-directed RNA polymerase subunit omega|nr:DNA-directed RNA polymerase subunit omega [Lactobacillaceae bacterium]
MSLIYPSVDELLEKIDSRYRLVSLAAKRAHKLDDFYKIKAVADARGREVQLTEDKKEIAPTLEVFKSHKSVGKALEEINAGNVIIDPSQIDKDEK